MPASTRHTVLGKAILLLVLAAVLGYAINRNQIARNDEGRQLTVEQYTANYETHKAKLAKPAGPPWKAVFGAAGLTAIVFGLYEGLGAALGLLIKKTGLLPHRERNQQDIDSEIEQILEGRSVRDLSVSFARVHLLALPLLPLLVVPILAPYWLVWGWGPVPEGFKQFVHPLAFFPVVLGSIVVHELLHGLGFIWFGRVPWRQIRFGVKWKGLVAYAVAVSPVTAKAYRLAGSFPGLMLGVLPGLGAIITGNGWLLIYGLLMTISAVGDLIILWNTRSIDCDALVLDRSDRAGCWVLDDGPTDSATSPSSLE